MSLESLKQDFVKKYQSEGSDKFYKSLLLVAVKQIVLTNTKHVNPHLELLEYHNQFMILYRREGEDIYLEIAKACRRAAHKIYRLMLKKDLAKINNKFLTLV